MNASQYQISEYLNELDLERVIFDLTGQSVDLRLRSIFEMPLGDFSRDAIELAIFERHSQAVNAAFAAGLACGLDPERLLLARLSAMADRLDRCCDQLEGVTQ